MDKRAEKYAKLVINTGINIQKGQTLLITAPVDAAEFARLCVKEAYKAGCKNVELRWKDDAISKETYLHADDSVFDEFPSWKADMLNSLSADGAAFLSIYSEDPEALSGVDADRIRRSSVASGKALAEFRQRQMTDEVQWCLFSVPNPAWAKKVFPELSEDEAVSKLWDAIYDTVRISEDNDPVDEWAKHERALCERKKKLTEYNFKYLKYKNSLGTDLTIELPEGHFWEGGCSTSGKGVKFTANMPTEEIFTAPKLDGVNGIVYASKPLVINGDIADKFSFTFENGKIVKVSAEKGQELLETAISTDEGAAYLGEVALVPYDSPISSSGILFYNTLFDENASCHLAFGASYPCINGGSEMSADERKAHGLNDSIMHEDFMVGTRDLSIIGVTHDGAEIPVFVDGNFAF
jgi:aminopeptidase